MAGFSGIRRDEVGRAAPLRGDREFFRPLGTGQSANLLKYPPLPDVCAVAPDVARSARGAGHERAGLVSSAHEAFVREGRGNVDEGQANQV